MNISLLSPIYPNTHLKENLSFLRFSTHFFDFGQTAYRVKNIRANGIEVKEHLRERPSWIGTLLRVVAIMTIIIPLIMLLGLAIYTLVNNFYLAPPSNKGLENTRPKRNPGQNRNPRANNPRPNRNTQSQVSKPFQAIPSVVQNYYKPAQDSPIYMGPSRINTYPLHSFQRETPPQSSTASLEATQSISSEEEGDTCTICYVELKKIATIGCDHKFHLECIEKWQKECINKGSDPTCPICRNPFTATQIKILNG